MIANQILDELNEKQRLAVTAPRKSLLVLAGPGTGKTRTLIARILYEIQHYKISPEEILALTFSNKAASEIKSRIENVLKEQSAKLRVSTFHSFCLDVLRKYYELAGLDKHFSICDDDYQSRLVKQLIANRTRDQVDKKVKGIMLAFSNLLLKDKPLPAFSAAIFDEYTSHLNKHRLIDYNLLLTKTLQLFKNHNDVLNQYRFLNQSILVDEFQDTDPVQYEIMKLLSWKHRNIFVVADDDQSIYAWRGANPENINRYIEDFSIAQPIFLDVNYRSGAGIMDPAQQIVRSTERLEPDKDIRSDLIHDSKITAIFFRDESQEINYILKKIVDWSSNHNLSFADIAVIYPQHRFGDRLAEYLLKERIPYQLAAGKNLNEHPLMQKIILYLKMVRDPSDSLLLEQLVEKELGYHIYKQVQDYRNIHQISFRKALNELSQRNEISYKTRNQIATFIGGIANLVNLKNFFTFDRLLQEIIRGSQDINQSVLNHNSAKIENTSIKMFKKISDPNVNLWLYHPDQKISYVASKMLEAAFGNRIHILTNDRLMHVKKTDFALLLDSLSTENLNCEYELLFKQFSGKRKGILSNLFRWLQLHLQSKPVEMFDNYVVFDLETTGKDPDKCGIVEIAAVKIENKKIVDEFQTLINPKMPIEKEAQAVHNIKEEQIQQAPTVGEIWPKFIEFIGNDLLIAHNGYGFDFKIIDRFNKQLRQPKITNTRYDSLILARNIYPNQQNSIDALVQRFKLDAGTRHRALDDVKVLHKIFQKLVRYIHSVDTKTQGEAFTEYVALGNLIENKLSATEDKIYFLAGIQKLCSPYSRIRDKYTREFSLNDQEFTANLARISERMNFGNKFYQSSDDFYKRTMEVAIEFKSLPIDQAIAEFLSYLSLINPQDGLTGIDAVSLLTYHSAKGLEFEKVIILGMEDDSMPSFFAYKTDDEDDRSVSKKLEEQKRLLYVGITRAKNEVVLTVVKNRFGRMQKSSPFLDEIKNEIEIKTYH